MFLTPIISCHLRTQKHYLVKNTPPGVPYLVPVPCYLLEHKGEYWLFDAGEVPPEVPQKEDVAFYILMKEEDRVVHQLKKMQIPLSSLKGIILSHFHSDHINGVRDFPDTPIYIRKRDGEKLPSFVKNLHFLEDGMIDFFGDSSCILFPTYGHTPGHQSLLLTLESGKKLLLAADAAYTKEELERGRHLFAPATEQEESLLRILALEQEGVLLVPGHDPDFDFSLLKEL